MNRALYQGESEAVVALTEQALAAGLPAERILQEGLVKGMKVVGEEGTPVEDFVVYLKSEFLDGVYLQQNTFDDTDGATSDERQRYTFGKAVDVLDATFAFADKAEARSYFLSLRQKFIDWNYSAWGSDEFRDRETAVDSAISEAREQN